MSHPMRWAGEYQIDAGGRKLKLCADCGRVNVGLVHSKPRDMQQVARDLLVQSISPANATPEPDAMVLLRIACKQVMELPTDAIGWRMRLRVLDVLKAFEITDDLPLIESPAPIKHEHVSTGVASGSEKASALVRRGIRGDYSQIGLRAVEAGWSVRRTGDQHFIFTRPDLGGVFTLPSTGGEGRGYKNAKAQARRAGLDVEGL